ncbi:hypothetical protein Y1Q_0006094 [Alligator mississippiensis]|uniref:Uncharacterized protein n=1 Tax=Alligator mississippiensis TaxID=8496 RepID=A0A151N3X3_ALLMI|nr:hypothetical protein Y1Q_0006094 [Alligator mississippiensis]
MLCNALFVLLTQVEGPVPSPARASLVEKCRERIESSAESTGEPRSMASLKDAWADKQSGRPASLRCPPDDPNLIWRSQPF